MLVKELMNALAPKPGDQTIFTDLGDIQVDEEATSLEIGGEFFHLDEMGDKALGAFLPIPAAYLKKCPPDLKAHNLRYWFDRYSEASVQIEIEHGHLIAIHSDELVTVPNVEVAKVVAQVFEPEDQVKVYSDYNQLHVDVISLAHEIDVPNPAGVVYRPLVGDITRGGVRILTYPHAAKDPSVCYFFERLACTNGMTTTQKMGTISIKGSTVDDVIGEMEFAAQHLLGKLDEHLERYAATAKIPVPGNLQAFAQQLAREYKLKREVLDEVLNIINQLPDNATVYDVIQAFTQVANLGDDLPYVTRMRLQELGGMLALDTERQIARCRSCERLLR